MSHNGNFRMGAPISGALRLGAAYAPDAQGSAEGDILNGLREDDADVRLRGLREDDADVRLRGLREDDADVRLRGLREDDAAVRMGDVDDLNAEAGRIEQEQPGMGGLREDDADVRLRGLREDDANISLRGLREDDADVRLRGLREDDADMRLGNTAHDGATGDAEGSAEGHRDAQLGVSAYDAQPAVMTSDGKRGGMGTAYEIDAEGSSEDPASRAGRMGVSAYDLGRRSASYDDALGVSAYDGLGVSAYDELGRKRRFGPGSERHKKIFKKTHFMKGAEEQGPKLGAEDFHERFPVTVEIKGLGRIDTSLRGYQAAALGNIFDTIFGRTMSFEEFIGKLRVIADQWGRIKPRMDKLPPSTLASIKANMKTAEASYDDYTSTVPAYIIEGKAGFDAHDGRHKRVLRWEAYLPTVDKLVSQAEVLGTSYTPPQVKQDAIQDVTNRQVAASSTNVLNDTILPIAGVAAGTALVAVLLSAAL